MHLYSIISSIILSLNPFSRSVADLLHFIKQILVGIALSLQISGKYCLPAPHTLTTTTLTTLPLRPLTNHGLHLPQSVAQFLHTLCFLPVGGGGGGGGGGGAVNKYLLFRFHVDYG